MEADEEVNELLKAKINKINAMMTNLNIHKSIQYEILHNLNFNKLDKMLQEYYKYQKYINKFYVDKNTKVVFFIKRIFYDTIHNKLSFEIISTRCLCLLYESFSNMFKFERRGNIEILNFKEFEEFKDLKKIPRKTAEKYFEKYKKILEEYENKKEELEILFKKNLTKVVENV